jgi:N-formylglutamate amidohydrolase
MAAMPPLPPPSFDILGGPHPASPVILAVPHAGRDYPLAMRANLRVPVERLLLLEDRHADSLALAARGDEWTIIAHRARAWIDLNRSEMERDPLLDHGARPGLAPASSAKVRNGLGLIPRRTSATGDIWARRLEIEDVEARIRHDHRPYHAAIGEALQAAHARFGVAVLLDVHSMPSLGRDGAQIVIGDRFGRSAAARISARIEAAARDAGLRVAANAPYPGGHTLDRHADLRRGVHAVQLEIDRSLYLDAAHDRVGPGFDATAGLLRDIIAALTDEALPQAIAAE